MNNSRSKNLKSFAQKFQPTSHLGAKKHRKEESDPRAEEFSRLQRATGRTFYINLGVLTILFIGVMGLTFIFRDSISNIGIVFGGGGVILGGILRLMGSVLKEKARLDLFSLLLKGLPEEQLGLVLQVVAQGDIKNKVQIP